MLRVETMTQEQTHRSNRIDCIWSVNLIIRDHSVRCQLLFVIYLAVLVAVVVVVVVDVVAAAVNDVAAARGLLVRPSLQPYYWVYLNSSWLM